MHQTFSLSFAQAINEALHEAMQQDDKVICYGLGVDDPKRIFGTTKDLKERFGAQRVFDMPTSENAMTGIAIGVSLNGYRPVMVHQRLDFFLLAVDQLVNNAAKWHYMFGGQRSVPITIRLIIGRGWGQGPTHSQSLHAWFAHIPGLKVVMPASVADAKALLLASIFDDNPVLFLEHRWLHNMKGELAEDNKPATLGKAHIARKGSHITLVAFSYMVVEALHAIDFMGEHGVQCELIDVRTVHPLDFETIYESVKRTGRVLVLDIGMATGSVAGEIITRVTSHCWEYLQYKPERIAMPDVPEPTSFAMTEDLHPRAEHIALKINEMLGLFHDVTPLVAKRNCQHDVPGDWFTGPF